jgi:hypothetical protein
MTTTIVSGYWDVKGKHTSENFNSWFKNTLVFNNPYIFFGNSHSIEIVKKIRKDLPTFYCELTLDDFYTKKYKHFLAPHEIHNPSSEVCMIWLEKIFLTQRAKNLNPFNTDFFLWVDAGICSYRFEPPPPQPFDKSKIKLLPTNKFIFCSTEEPFSPHFIHENHYYHYVSGAAFMLHISFIDAFVKEYISSLDRYINNYNWLHTEQKILTHMLQNTPQHFHKLGEGYGALLACLY